jgi:hypothetical protein
MYYNNTILTKVTLKLILISFSIFYIFFSCSELPIKSQKYIEYSSVKDFEYLQNQYFFIDNFFHDRFEEGHSENLQLFIYPTGKDVVDLEVWISTLSTDPYRLEALAVSNPENFTNINIHDYTPDQSDRGIYKGYFKLLSDSLYNFDDARGFLGLNEPVQPHTVLAVSYKTSDGESVGTLSNDDTTGNFLLRLIKVKFQVPSDSTWSLMMKNVYFLGDNLKALPDFDLQIVHANTGDIYANEGDEESLLTLLGLDILDNDEKLNADGKFDFNPLFFDKSTGVLIFPGLHPFDPLPESAFQLDENSRVKIYNETNPTYFLYEHRYNISLLTIK